MGSSEGCRVSDSGFSFALRARVSGIGLPIEARKGSILNHEGPLQVDGVQYFLHK